MVLIATEKSTKSTLMKKHQNTNYRTLTQGRLTVTMLDDATTATMAAIPSVWVVPNGVSVPALIEGFHLPNRFRVEGLDVPIEMEVSEFRRNGVPFFGCTSFVVTSPVETDGIKDIPKIPLATLVKMAVKCARTLCMYYPPHYEGALLDHKFRPTAWKHKVGNEPDVQPVKSSPPKGKTWSDEAINKLIGKPPRRRKTEITDEFLQEVASVYNNAGTFPLKAVMNHFHKCPKTTADKWVSKCKERGYITPNKKKATK
jgi:hypothetical protein